MLRRRSKNDTNDALLLEQICFNLGFCCYSLTFLCTSCILFLMNIPQNYHIYEATFILCIFILFYFILEKTYRNLKSRAERALAFLHLHFQVVFYQQVDNWRHWHFFRCKWNKNTFVLLFMNRHLPAFMLLV